MEKKEYVIGNASSKDVGEKLKELPFALAMIEQLRGGMAIRGNHSRVKELVDGLLCGVPFLGYPIKTPFQLFRGRIENENRHLNQMSDFGYVPIEKSNSYGRCHRPKSTVFYGANNLDTVLSELSPEIGDIVHVGVADVHCKEELIITAIGEIEHTRRFNRPLIGNPETKELLNNVLVNSGSENNARSLLVDAFFADAFSQPASNKKDYKITCALAELLFEISTDDHPHTFDGFAYPSVAHRGGINFAIKPDSFDSKFEWKEFMAFEITDYLGFGLYGRQQYSRATPCEPQEKLKWNAV